MLGKVGGHEEVRRWSDFTAVVTEIAAHEDECGGRGGCTGETSEVACCMARGIEQIK